MSQANRELKGEIVRHYGSQYKFAHAIGCHESIVSQVIRGRLNINDQVKQKWAAALGAEADKLFGREAVNG